MLLSSLSKIIIKKRLTCYEQVPVINFHGIVKNGATLKISTSLVTLQNRFTSEMCLQLLSYSQPAIPFSGSVSSFWKENKHITSKHFSKACPFFEKNQDVSLLSIFHCSFTGCTWSCCKKHSPYMVSISKLMSYFNFFSPKTHKL